jgi:hypothetical protein
MKPPRVIPRHVAACQHSPEHAERWFVWTWNRGTPAVQHRIPYSCNSWRCEVCRRHEAAVTFARIKEATAPLPAHGWCFLVLTIDRDGYYSGKPWADVNEAYRALGKMTTATLKQIGATWGPDTRLEGRKRIRTVRKLGNRWVAVVEAHRSGWPHVNLLVWCPELAELLRRESDQRLEDPDVADAVALARDAWTRKEPIPAAVRALARKATTVGGALRDIVEAAGWGRESTAEAARSSEAIAGYVVKLAGQHDAAAGELAKITQAPMNAPERFRRLRSGKGFLPPRRTDPNVTGCLVRRRRAVAGDWEICAINAPKDPAQLEPIACAAEAELQLIFEEEAILCRARGKRLPAMPPIRIAVRGALESHKQTSERRAAMQARELAAAG